MSAVVHVRKDGCYGFFNGVFGSDVCHSFLALSLVCPLSIWTSDKHVLMVRSAQFYSSWDAHTCSSSSARVWFRCCVECSVGFRPPRREGVSGFFDFKRHLGGFGIAGGLTKYHSVRCFFGERSTARSALGCWCTLRVTVRCLAVTTLMQNFLCFGVAGRFAQCSVVRGIFLLLIATHCARP